LHFVAQTISGIKEIIENRYHLTQVLQIQKV